MSGVNTFTELFQVIEGMGISVAEQTRQFRIHLNNGIEIEDEKELLITAEGLFDIAPNGDLYRVAIFINQLNARENPAYLSGDDWHKFHLYRCRTIENYPISRGYRYKKTNNRQGRFQYIITWHNREYREDLRVAGRELHLCKNCRGRLPPDWRRHNVTHFPLQQFYQQTSGTGLGDTLEYDCDQIPQLYARDWDKIARRFKEKRHWRCEQCYLYLADNRHYLHAHHVDGDPANNAIANLKALCIRCHAAQPLHEHIKRQDEYRAFIRQYPNNHPEVLT